MPKRVHVGGPLFSETEREFLEKMVGALANVDGRGFQEQRYTARSWRRLLQDPVLGIDNKVPWFYCYWQSNEGQGASLRIEMGNPNLLKEG